MKIRVLPYWNSLVRSFNGSLSKSVFHVLLLLFLEAELCSSWLYCKQVAFMLEVFTIGVVDRSQMGSYRVELLVRLFDRIVDLYNFEMIMMNLNAEEQAAVYFRIGNLQTAFL